MWYTTSKVVWSWVVVNIRCPGHSRGINYSALNQTLNFWKEKYIEIFKSVHEVLEVFCRHDNVVINTVGGNPPQSFPQNLLFAGRQHIFGTAWWFPCFGTLKYFHRILGNFFTVPIPTHNIIFPNVFSVNPCTMAKDNNDKASPTGVIIYFFTSETHNSDLDKTPPLPFYGRPNYSFARFVTPQPNHV